METREREHIRRHLNKILELSSCNICLLAYLESKGLLGASDMDLLNSIGPKFEKMHTLLKILETRVGAYKHLLDAFMDTRQSGVAAILGAIDLPENVLRNAEKMLTDDLEKSENKTILPWPHKMFGIRPPDQLFTGRQKELQVMHEYLSCPENVGIFTLAGLGGIGKTQLAKKYIELNKEDYKYIFWINSEDVSSIHSTFRKIAVELSISLVNAHGEERETEFVIQEVYSTVSTEKCLIVFDNTELSKNLSMYLPSQYLSKEFTTLRAINTSRDKDWHTHGKVLTVQGFDRDDAVRYIKVGLNISETSRDGLVLKLAKKLHFFPLALSQSVAYIREANSMRDFDIEAYLREFDENTIKFLQFSSIFETHIYNDYELTTYTTWHITIEKIKSYKTIGPLSAEILQYCSYMLPDNIETAIFFAIPDQAEENILGSLRLLVKFSMLATVDKQKQYVSIHRMVQEVMRIGEREKGFEVQNLGNLVSLLDIAPFFTNHHEILLEHQVCVFNRGLSDTSFLSFYNNMPSCFVRRLVRIFKATEAIEYGLIWKNALSQAVGDKHEACLDLEHEIAKACLKAGKFTAAISHMKFASAGYESHCGTKLLEKQRVFAGALMKLGNQKEALEILTEMLRKFKTLESEVSQANYGDLLLDIGKCQRHVGNYDKVLGPYLEALEIFETVKNKEKVNIVKICIANFHGTMGRNVDAVNVLQKLVDSFDKNETRSPSIISAGYSLSLFLSRLRQYKQAEKYCKQALENSTKILGTLHPRTITCKGLLADIYEGNNNLVGANSLKKTVYYEFRNTLGETHYKTHLAKALFAASWIDTDPNSIAEAEYVIDCSLQELKESEISRDYVYFFVQIKFAKILIQQKKYSECKAFLDSIKVSIQNSNLNTFDTQPLDAMLEEIEEHIVPQIQRLKIFP